MVTVTFDVAGTGASTDTITMAVTNGTADGWGASGLNSSITVNSDTVLQFADSVNFNGTTISWTFIAGAGANDVTITVA